MDSIKCSNPRADGHPANAHGSTMASVSIAQPHTLAGARVARGAQASSRAARVAATMPVGRTKINLVSRSRSSSWLAPGVDALRRGPSFGGAARRIVNASADVAAAATAYEAAPEKSTVVTDIIAGVSTACVAMPQSCAYALLAGTGVKCAVMAAAAASIPCAILGSSRYLQVGCLSLGALLTRGALVNLGIPLGSEVYVMGAATLAFYAGVTRVACGVAKLGNIMTSLPVSILQGFVWAATWMVLFSQVPAMVGAAASGPLAGHFATAAGWLAAHPMIWHPGNFALAAATIVIMLNGGKIHKMFPSALVCCVLGCVLAATGVDVGACVGAIQVDLGSLFPPAALQIGPEIAKALVIPGIALGVITYLEGAAVCRFWAEQDGEEWSSDKELVAQGVANICSAAVGGMTVAGVISRSSFGILSGAKTKLSHFVTGCCLIAFTVLGGGALLEVLPKAVLGALVSCGVLPLLGPTPKMKPLFDNIKSQPYEVKRDCILACATAVFTFTARPTLDIGLYRGIGLALVFKLFEYTRNLDKKKNEDFEKAQGNNA